MSEHRVIQYDSSWCPTKRHRARKGTPGIYGLVDPRDMRVRYVGSSNRIEARLYSHTHSRSAGCLRVPREKWLAALAAEGVKPCAVVLEVGDFGAPQSLERHDAESRWIATYELVGEADLNVRLTAPGSVHSKDSRGKTLHHEVRELRAKVAYLESELAKFRTDSACNAAQRGATLPPVAVAQSDSLQRNATHPFRGCCMLQRSGGQPC